MKATVAALLLFTVVFCCETDAYSDHVIDCCLKTSGTPVPRQIAKTYIVQGLDSSCPIEATVFITKKNRRLCSPPAEDNDYPWVKKLIAHLDRLGRGTN